MLHAVVGTVDGSVGTVGPAEPLRVAVSGTTGTMLRVLLVEVGVTQVAAVPCPLVQLGDDPIGNEYL